MQSARIAVVAFVATAITVGALWFTSHSVTTKKATQEDVLTQANRGGYRIISVDELWERHKKYPQELILVDTRQEWEYRAGHIKGALNFPLEPTWLSRWRKKDALERFLGPDKNRVIVFY